MGPHLHLHFIGLQDFTFTFSTPSQPATNPRAMTTGRGSRKFEIRNPKQIPKNKNSKNRKTRDGEIAEFRAPLCTQKALICPTRLGIPCGAFIEIP
jgi:hypothetical protein